MKIGDKRLVVSEPPYGMCGINERPARFIELEIIETHTGTGEFTGKEHKGFLANGSDGYQYGFNYPTANEGFGNTPWVIYAPDDVFNALSEEEQDTYMKNYMWHDIAHFQCPAEAIPAKSKDYIEYCEHHQRHFYTDKECFRCKHDVKPIEDRVNTEEHSWVGWYEEVTA